MRVMGIDYGDSRIGIALSDPLGWTAQGLETISRKGSLDAPLKRIREIVNEYNIEKIVVGFPKNMNGTIGPRGEKTLEFIDLLDKHINGEHEDDGSLGDNTSLQAKANVHIIKWDERLTTVAANRTMHEMGVKTSKKKGLVDQIAATYILQGYLDSSGK